MHTLTEQCEAMEFSPFRVPDGKTMCQVYLKLNRRKSLYQVPTDVFEKMEEQNIPTSADLDLLVRFLSLFCSVESPFYNEENYEERILACWHALGVPEKHFLYKMVSTNHWWYSNVLLAFMQTQNNDLFSDWLAFKMAHKEHRAALMMRMEDSGDPEKFMAMQTKVSGNMNKVAAEALALEIKLFPHSKMAQAAYEAATAEEEIGGWAEEFAEDFVYSKSKKR